jgi:hypothetical protein
VESNDRQTTRARLLRSALVLAIVVVVNALALPGLWTSFGTFGMNIDPEWKVTAVSPGSSADLAGIQRSDRIDVSALSLSDRMILTTSATGFALDPPPSYPLTVHWAHGNTARTATLIAQSESRLFAVVPTVSRFTALVFTIIGALLVLIKPSRMTWAFFGYAVGATLGDPALLRGLSPTVYFDSEVVLDIVAVAGTVGFVVFALRFPRDLVEDWRGSLERATPFVAIAFVAMAVLIDVDRIVLGQNIASLQIVFDIGTLAITTLGVAALLTTYFQLSGANRERIKWVASALVLSYAAQLAIIVMSQYYVPYTPLEDYGSVLRLVFLTVPLSVAYAVLHHRVIDVRVFISRALVFGLLTTLLVVIFTLVDLIFVKMLDAGEIALPVEIISALALGFWLDRMHRSLDRIIDLVFFRQRYLGQRQIDRAAAILQHAQSVRTIDDCLIQEPFDAFALTSAALFVRSADGNFSRKFAIAWHSGTSKSLDHDDKIALTLSAEQAPLRIEEINRDRAHLPQGSLAPVIAIPILLRRRLEAVALYGPHENGADLDADEIKSLNVLAQAASAAYDHLEAKALRREVVEQRAELRKIHSEETHKGPLGAT